MQRYSRTIIGLIIVPGLIKSAFEVTPLCSCAGIAVQNNRQMSAHVTMTTSVPPRVAGSVGRRDNRN